MGAKNVTQILVEERYKAEDHCYAAAYREQ